MLYEVLCHNWRHEIADIHLISRRTADRTLCDRSVPERATRREMGKTHRVHQVCVACVLMSMLREILPEAPRQRKLKRMV